jgi:hypothetical protein
MPSILNREFFAHLPLGGHGTLFALPPIRDSLALLEA